jgi:hypothetical protein
MQSRNRIRSKGHGHRRRLSGIQISRTSVYETIEEENHTPVTDGFPDSVKASLSPVIDDGVIIVDPEDASTIQWDERGIVALRKYYTLKGEADITIEESKQSWLDTPFSIFAVQCTSYLISGRLPLIYLQLLNRLPIAPACERSWNILARHMDHFLLNFAASVHAPILDRRPTHNRSGQSKSLYLP